MNPEKQHKKLFDLQTKAALSDTREMAKKILKKYEKALAKLARAGASSETRKSNLEVFSSWPVRYCLISMGGLKPRHKEP